MGTYSVSEVEKLTGIRSHTLRMWERRYDFLSASRTSTNIRAYSEDELKKLLNVNILVKNGFRLNKLDKMSDDQIKNSVIEILDAPVSSKEDEIQGLTLAMLQLNEERFATIIDKQVAQSGLLETTIDLIYPFLYHIGALWRTDRAEPAFEHFVSNIIRRKLLAAIDAIPFPDEDAKKLLLFLPEGEYHEMGLLLSDFIAKDQGWRTFYLGQNVPIENLSNVIQQISPDLMFSIILTPRTSKQNALLKECIENTNVKVICSGSKEVVMQISCQITYLENPRKLVDYLGEFAR